MDLRIVMAFLNLAIQFIAKGMIHINKKIEQCLGHKHQVEVNNSIKREQKHLLKIV
jgi:hypothetical protein